jgi:hypothetical protein
MAVVLALSSHVVALDTFVQASCRSLALTHPQGIEEKKDRPAQDDDVWSEEDEDEQEEDEDDEEQSASDGDEAGQGEESRPVEQ